MAPPIPLIPSIIATDRQLPIRQGIIWEHPAVHGESPSLDGHHPIIADTPAFLLKSNHVKKQFRISFGKVYMLTT
ncbi:MAG: hypothetical protein H8D23_27685 [Candidatus Brocadiales bacterium]|nr:hypothetical protein [Candidatus Brocadiales bacterium]